LENLGALTVSVSELTLFAISLLAMFSPLATLGPAASLLGEAPLAAQRKVALLVARNYVAVTVLTVLLGSLLLTAVGISTAALTLTGGAALLHQGWPLMTRAGKAADRDVPDLPTAVKWEELAAVPLTFPITIGGGTIAVVIGAASRCTTLIDLASVAAVCAVVGIPVFLTIMFAGRMVRRLSAGAIDAVNRVSGIILFGLGAQLAVTGLYGLYRAADTALHLSYVGRGSIAQARAAQEARSAAKRPSAEGCSCHNCKNSTTRTTIIIAAPRTMSRREPPTVGNSRQ